MKWKPPDTHRMDPAKGLTETPTNHTAIGEVYREAPVSVSYHGA